MHSRLLGLVIVAAACGRPPVSAPTPALDSSLKVADVAPVHTETLRLGMPVAVVRQNNYRIESSDLAIEVDPADGGRIVEFSHRGVSVVLDRATSPGAYGSSFWTSPQSDWQWPPPLELDQAAWSPQVSNRSLILKSKTIEKLLLSATQSLHFDEAHATLVIEYQLRNEGDMPRKVAPWQNTRVAPGGLTFYPTSGRAAAPAVSSLELEPVQGVVWYQHVPSEVKKSQKIFSNAQEGWLAHLTQGLLFLKLFEDIEDEEQAPGQGEIEIYAHEDGSFVEVEQQGAYTTLGPGETLRWPVHWVLRPVPDSIKAEPESQALLSWVRQLARELAPRGSAYAAAQDAAARQTDAPQ